jgi:hypothetical protein
MVHVPRIHLEAVCYFGAVLIRNEVAKWLAVCNGVDTRIEIDVDLPEPK